MKKQFDIADFIYACYADQVYSFKLNYEKGIAVVGAHFGDCGKGKFDDLIIRRLKEEGYKVAKKKDVKLVGIELVELYKKVLDK